MPETDKARDLHNKGDFQDTSLEGVMSVIQKAGVQPGEIAALGITNQRETTLVWSRKTGKPVCNAIVWQSRVSTPICERLRAGAGSFSGNFTLRSPSAATFDISAE